MATIRDVAQRAGVGIGTVSRVINNSPGVSPGTRRRVLDVIAELNFTPSRTARRLSLGRTLAVAVIVPFFTRPAFVERLRGVESVLAETDYDLIVYNVETPQRRDQLIPFVARRDRVDGLLMISLLPGERHIPLLERAEVPVVLLDVQHADLSRFSRVNTDDVGGARMAVRHLIALGHRRIAFIGDAPESPFHFTSSRDRHQGYRQALEEAGLRFCAQYSRTAPHGCDEARALTAAMLGLAERPTAIFAASDTQALGALEACRAAGLDVPRDISIVGYDDIELARYLGLTTVRQQLFASGRSAAKMLLRRLDRATLAPEMHTLPTELVVRSTTAPPQ